MRTGNRNSPLPSVMATKVLPVSSFVAVMVTPGSTPPVESVTVPFSVASCAYPVTGRTSIPTTTNHADRFLNSLIEPPAGSGQRCQFSDADRQVGFERGFLDEMALHIPPRGGCQICR